jgi:hypothetical protein
MTYKEIPYINDLEPCVLAQQIITASTEFVNRTHFLQTELRQP